MKIDKIVLDANVETREEMFSLVAQTLLEMDRITNTEEFLSALNTRESQSTTGLIDEIAIPHGQSPAVKESTVVYLRNAQGLEWASLDGSLVKHVFALAIKADDGNHLDNLIAISSNLMDQDQRDALKAFSDEEAIKNHFENA